MKKEKLKALENDNRLYINGNTIREKYYLKERQDIGKQIDNFWGDVGNMNRSSDKPFGLDGQKPEKLIERIISLGSKEGDLVLDFFMGSGTTCAVAHKMKRNYIGIEQLHYGKQDFVVRLKEVIKGDSTGISESIEWKGGGSFIYCELMEWNEAFISKIKRAKTTKDLLVLWEDMHEKAFISYKIDPKTINANISEFKELSLEDQKRFLIETLDKNQLYVNYSEIDDKEYQVSEADKKINRMFYSVV